jgi:hypothetical protein
MVLAVVAVWAAVAEVRAADADPSTPAGAQRLVREAGEKGDKTELRRFLHASNATEEKLADAIAENAVAGAAAYKAAVAKFGEEETRKTLMGVVPIHPKQDDESKIQWKIDGNKATPTGPDKDKFAGPPLTKVDGVWKMAMSDVVAGRPNSEIEQMVQLLQKQSAMMAEYGKETEEGKFATAADLRKTALERMQAMLKQMTGGATTKTTTKPSSGGKSGEGSAAK